MRKNRRSDQISTWNREPFYNVDKEKEDQMKLEMALKLVEDQKNVE